MNERSAGSWRTIYPWRARAETYVIGTMLALVLLQGTAVADTVMSGYWMGAVAKANLVWVALAAGVPASTLDSAASPELIDLAVRVCQQLGNEQQLAWYRANRAPIGDCTTQPRLDPAFFASEQAR